MVSKGDDRLALILILMLWAALAACGRTDDGGSMPGSLSIQTPENNADVSENIAVDGTCSLIDTLTVTIDNDAFSKQAVACVRGQWSADFDTTRFQDGEHLLLAYANPGPHDQIVIRTSNGRLDGHSASVPVELADGIYDEIDEFTPLYVYAKRTSTGTITGRRYTAGAFPGSFDLPNLLNGLYEIGAVLDRNNNETLDEGFDFSGTAADLLEVSNTAAASGVVVLRYNPEPDPGGEDGTGSGDIDGTLSIETPDNDAQVSGRLTVSGYAGGDIEWVTVEIDDNRAAAQTVPVGGHRFSAAFDTARLQDGRHCAHAFAGVPAGDRVWFETLNGNEQGYALAVTVDLAGGLYDEIAMTTPLYVYARDPVTGGRITARHDSGLFGERFAILNVPNNTYQVGAFLDRNDDGVENGGDYAGRAAELVNVWYADAAARVVLVGNEVHISTPGPYAAIRANQIEMSGTYTFDPDEIQVLMHLTGVTYETVSAAALYANGTWSALLDITDVTQEGERWLYAKARYGARWHWDEVLIELDRGFDRSIAIRSPADGATVGSDALTVSGDYSGLPEAIAVSIERGDGTAIDVVATFANGTWSALFDDIASVQEGDNRTVTAVADFGGGILEQDSIDLRIRRTPATGVAITSPAQGDRVDSDSLSVQGTFVGHPNALTVSIERGTGGTLDRAATFAAGLWSAPFDDLSGVANGTRAITALADYGAGLTAVDAVSVNVDRPLVPVKAFTYRMVVTSPTADTADAVSWFNTNADCPVNELNVGLPWERAETIEMPFVSDDARDWCGGVYHEIALGLGASVRDKEATVRIYLNGDGAPFVADTAHQYPYAALRAYWDGDPDHDIVFEVR